MGNYVTVSVICHVAKNFGRGIHFQLMMYLIEINFISLNQSAYRPLRNTQTCMHQVVYDWLGNMGDNLLTGVCLFDMKKKML